MAKGSIIHMQVLYGPLPCLLQHDVLLDGDFNPYEDQGLDTIMIFYDKESAHDVKEEAALLVSKLRGLVGILMVDV